eukprot:1920280-Rhodomonas_salina.1
MEGVDTADEVYKAAVEYLGYDREEGTINVVISRKRWRLMAKVLKGVLRLKRMEESEDVSEDSEDGSVASSVPPASKIASSPLRTPAKAQKALKAAPTSPPPRNYTVPESVSKLLLILEGTPALSVAHLRALGQTLKRSAESVKALACVFLEWNAAKDTYGKTDARAVMKLSRALAQLLDGEQAISLCSSEDEEIFAAGPAKIPKAPLAKSRSEGV